MELPATLPDHPRRMLIADDDASLRMLVNATLSGLGYEIVEAADGQTALELANRLAVPVVILDVSMPGLDGWEVCARLKQSSPEGRAAPVVIMLTGTAHPPEHLDGAATPDRWLTKPFSPRQLLEVVDGLFRTDGAGDRDARPRRAGSADRSGAGVKRRYN